MKKILLTGGGTTGHVSVNLALIPRYLEDGYKVYYMGSKKGIERELVSKFQEVEYIPISTGKLRRYWSFENLKDVFRIIWGTLQAIFKIMRIRPKAIFSKGGYVAVPVIFGGFINRVPSITHESDLTPGLANKLCFPFVKEVMVTFEETLKYVPKDKGFYLGPVIRDELKNGKRDRGLKTYGFTGEKPVLLVMGGSLGAKALNETLRENLDLLLEKYDILHACGKGNLEPSLEGREGYVQREYISEGLNDVFAMADYIISRAGSNAIFEFLYYRKPMLLIPLPKSQSRGDQILNAQIFERRGWAKVLMEEDITTESLKEAIQELEADAEQIRLAQADMKFTDATETIRQEMDKLMKK